MDDKWQLRTFPQGFSTCGPGGTFRGGEGGGGGVEQYENYDVDLNWIPPHLYYLDLIIFHISINWNILSIFFFFSFFLPSPPPHIHFYSSLGFLILYLFFFPSSSLFCALFLFSLYSPLSPLLRLLLPNHLFLPFRSPSPSFLPPFLHLALYHLLFASHFLLFSSRR